MSDKSITDINKCLSLFHRRSFTMPASVQKENIERCTNSAIKTRMLTSIIYKTMNIFHGNEMKTDVIISEISFETVSTQGKNIFVVQICLSMSDATTKNHLYTNRNDMCKDKVQFSTLASAVLGSDIHASPQSQICRRIYLCTLGQ